MSRLTYWEECPGFQSQEQASQNAINAAEEGEANHGRMQKVIDQAFAASKALNLVVDGNHLLSTLRSIREEEGIDDYDYSLLAYCCRALNPYLTRRKPESALQEQIATIYDTNTNQEFTFGYYDLLLLFDNAKLGVVVDWKFGALPVPKAEDNGQGAGYALAVLQEFHNMEKLLVVFIQPKMGRVSHKLYHRSDIPMLMERVRNAVGGSVYVTTHWGQHDKTEPMLNVSPYCRFCERAGDCPKLHTQALTLARRGAHLAMPDSFRPEHINTPDEAAVAAYLCNVLEDAVTPIRKRALEIAKENGGSISFTAPDNKTVLFSIGSRGYDRVLGPAPLVADALAQFMDPMEVMHAAKLSITDLETVAAKAMQDLAKANGEKITKREAKERLASVLEAQGLLSKPNGTIEFLRLATRDRKKNKDTKQLTESETHE